MDARFPKHPDELSASWLSEAIGYRVDRFEVSYFSEGTGVIAWVMRLHLAGAPGCPATLIAKFPSEAAANRATAAAYDMYAREVRFYRDIAGSVSVRTPRCHFAAYDPSTNDFVLLLEDLGSLRIGDQVTGCSPDEAHAVITALAHLHASGWAPTRFASLVLHDNPRQRDGMIAGFGVGWPVVLSRWPELVPESARKAGDVLPAALAGLLDRMCRDPVCVSHADVRLDNIFFDRDGGVALVDWQSVCLSAPEQDLAYFVTQSVSPEQRAREDLVVRYHAELTRYGVDYDLATCRQRFRVSALYLMSYAVVIAGTLDLANERGEALARTILQNCFTALDEFDAYGLL